MIPEPAAFLTHSIEQSALNAESALLLEKPAPFTLTPSQITESMIGNLITKYQATDVQPPPEDYITLSDQTKVGGGDSNQDYNHGAIISLPTGYEAIWATASRVLNGWTKGAACIDFAVGCETHRFMDGGSWVWGTSLLNSYSGNAGGIATGGSISWMFDTFNCSSAVVAVEVLCRVTERRKEQWRAETHAKLLTAYKARLQEYEEKLARQKLEAGITIQGT